VRGLIKKLAWFRQHDELITANNKCFRYFDGNRKFSDYSYVVYDTELTGLDRKKDEIIAIGAVRISSLQIDLSETFHYYVRPENIDHTQATLIHKITPEQLKEAPPLSDVLPRFLEFVGSDLLVGHYVWIDTTFLNRATKRFYNGTLANPNLDTMRMAQIYKRIVLGEFHGSYQSENGGYNLQKLSRDLNLPFFDAHDALEDALQTAYLFLYLVKKLDKAGISTLNELFKAGREINWAPLKPDGN